MGGGSAGKRLSLHRLPIAFPPSFGQVASNSVRNAHSCKTLSTKKLGETSVIQAK